MAKMFTKEAELEMTPMIDVVFQLIIFFIVTIKVTEQINRDIVLPDSPHGKVIDARSRGPQSALTVEVDRLGRTSIQNVPVSDQQLIDITTRRHKLHGKSFSVMIRGDHRSSHAQVRRVMDICTGAGLSRVSFIAVQEHK